MRRHYSVDLGGGATISMRMDHEPTAEELAWFRQVGELISEHVRNPRNPNDWARDANGSPL